MKNQDLNLTKKDKKILLNLAKNAIKFRLEDKKFKIEEEKIPYKLKEKKASFVTLTINGNLRGCVGHILPIKELYLDVMENAESAGFEDPRFSPLTKEEFEKTQVEISILSLPKKLNYQNTQELVAFLEKNKPGVVLRKYSREATFLPQVWQELKNPKEFLSHLCLKAGLLPNEWERNCQIDFYEVEKIK